ncbi:hypothetical protein [Ureibacillus acetophenoni]|uniref:Uncharacterized protein n=1 Tax=Ureibacillus acetophenoni TaxID=614649 RepID=A0A285UCI5_9BACL|nr:hypothetical protein [Ureibacillus acetophenoni]SOC38286.1 hypothetical protein SAMN05877842_10483 [Ureibacillus acetophenoni]
MRPFMQNARNEKGGSSVKIIAYVLIFLLLLGGGLGVYYQYFNKAEFTQEEKDAASAIAQNEFNELSTISPEYSLSQQQEALLSLGYEENKKDQATTIYEKKVNNESDFYILLSVQPHETEDHLTRVLIQIFDKEHRAEITQLTNILTWQK